MSNDERERQARDAGARTDRILRGSELEALRRDRRFLDSIVQSAWDGIMVVDPMGRLTYANKAMELLFGHELSGGLDIDALAKRCFPDPEEARVVLDLWKKDTLRGEPAERVWCITRGDGERRWCRFQLNPLPWGVVVNAQDITQRLAMEAELRERESRLRTLFEAAAIGMAVTTPDGHFEQVNPAFCRLLGYAEAELLERTSASITHPDDLSAGRRQSWDVMAGERQVVDLEKRYLHKDGQPVWCHTTVAWVFDDQSQPLRALVMVQDISVRKRMEQELLAVEKMESLGVLAGGIAHDFNNLLTGILGSATLGIELTEPNSPLQMHLDRVQRAGLRARDLTQQLLTFAKGGAPVRETRAVGELVRDAAELALRGSQVALRANIAGNLWLADVDAGQLGQVVQNLVLNAGQALPDGGSIQLTMANQDLRAGNEYGLAPGRYLALSVADQGPGISAEDRARIFDPFFTTKEGGTGLGLATSWTIVQRHDGTIHVASEPGRGCCFTVFLPASGGVERPRSVASEGGMLSGGRVLVMDDEEDLRQVCGAMLCSFGMEPTMVPDGQAALEAYTQALECGAPFDLVILDLTVVGGLGGLETQKALLALDPQVRSVVSSGYSTDPTMAAHREHGFVDVLAKPYTLRELALVIGRVLG